MSLGSDLLRQAIEDAEQEGFLSPSATLLIGTSAITSWEAAWCRRHAAAPAARLYATVPRGADPQSHQVDPYLETLRELAPAQPRYPDARRERGKLVARWNLVVPERILARSWSQVR